MKIIYMGTPDFAVAPLEAIWQAGHEITAVVTQPDKQKGRGKEVQFSPVKEWALKHHIPVMQPVRIKEAEPIAELRKYPADIFVVAAFGQLLTEEILQMPKYGCINIHASLLPAYRGAAPIQWVILNGEKKTGVTIMQMDRGLDTGDMLLWKETEIEEKETGESLHDKLMAIGAVLIVEALAKIEKGGLEPRKQEDALSCYAPRLTKAMGRIDWTREAVVTERQIRGLNAWPSAYTFWKGKQMKIWTAEVVKHPEETGGNQTAAGIAAKPGEILQVARDSFLVQTGSDALKITELQPEGKKKMPVRDFLLGYKLEKGMKLE